jgi:hypothetical protein
LSDNTTEAGFGSQAKGWPIVIASIILGIVFWWIVFEAKFSNFWVKMAVATVIISGISLFFAGPDVRKLFTFRPRHIIIGVGSAIVLYFVFVLGKIILTAIFPSAGGSISSVYAPRTSVPLPIIAVLLLFVTSPAEEIFWRGMIQRFFMIKWGPWLGFVAGTVCYMGVHIVTLNVPLILAALTAGFVWGLIYRYEKSLIPGIISHSLWATAIFVLFPVS